MIEDVITFLKRERKKCRLKKNERNEVLRGKR